MANDIEGAPIRPRNVLVIGGGAAGLVTLRNLVERGSFDRVELVERRDDVGGIWYHEAPVEFPSDSNATTINRPQWPSPAYPGLIGNVLPQFLSFSGYPFPDPPEHPHQPFPTLNETYEYLKGFAQPFIDDGRIRLNTEVVRVKELPEGKGWKIRSRDWAKCESNEGLPLEAEEVWDAVAVCAGYYDKPVWPQTEGLDVVRKRGIALHAKWWNGPDGYEGKRILVIGNATSSNDIAAQLAPLAQSPVYRSMRRPTPYWFPHLPDSRVENVGPVLKYVLQPAEEYDDGTVSEKVSVILRDGREIKDVDLIILGTGYCPHPEFVHVLPIEHESRVIPSSPSSVSSSSSQTSQSPNSTHVPLMAYTDPVEPQLRRVPFLHRHIIYAYNPSLAFIGAILALTPFVVADVASSWLALAWSGDVSLPNSIDARLAFDRKRIGQIEKMLEMVRAEGESIPIENGTANSETTEKEKEEPSSFITYSFLGEGEGGESEYANDLRRDIVDARPKLDEVLPVWDDETIKKRVAMFPSKLEALKWSQAHSV